MGRFPLPSGRLPALDGAGLISGGSFWTVLVNYFGFDLRVVAPISVLRHMQEAKRQGIQIPDGHLLEACRQDDLLFVFDATAAARPEAQDTIAALVNRGRDVVQLTPEKSDPHLAERPICFVGTDPGSPLARQALFLISWASPAQATAGAVPTVLIGDDLTQLVDLLDLADALNRNIQTSFVLTALPAVVSLAGIFFLNFGVVTAIVLNYTGLGLGVLYTLVPPVAGRATGIDSESER